MVVVAGNRVEGALQRPQFADRSIEMFPFLDQIAGETGEVGLEIVDRADDASEVVRIALEVDVAEVDEPLAHRSLGQFQLDDLQPSRLKPRRIRDHHGRHAQPQPDEPTASGAGFTNHRFRLMRRITGGNSSGPTCCRRLGLPYSNQPKEPI